MFDAKPIIQRLKSYGKQNNVNQSAIAKRISVSGPTLSRWLNEKTSFNPTLNQLVNMAEMLGVSLIELLSLEGNVTPTPAGKDDKEAAKPAKRAQKASKAKASEKTKAASVSSSDEKKKSKRTVKTSAVTSSAKGTTAKAEETERKATVKKPAKASKKTTAKADTGKASAKKSGRARKSA